MIVDIPGDEFANQIWGGCRRLGLVPDDLLSPMTTLIRVTISQTTREIFYSIPRDRKEVEKGLG